MRRHKIVYSVFFFICFLIFQKKAAFTESYDQIDDLINAIESQLKTGSQKVLDLYYDACSEKIDKCENKMYDRCDIYEPDEVGTYYQNIQIDDCKKKGLELSFKSAVGGCSNNVNCQSQEIKRIGCAMSTLFEDESMQSEKDSYIFSQYIGFYNTFNIAYPYKHDQFTCGDCKDQDPTQRPWYTIGLMGPKNVIIAFDTTKSMEGKRLNLTQVGIQNFINSLNGGDWFQIVGFDSKSQTFNGQTKLVQATEENKQMAEEWVLNIETGSGTNFEKAFNMIFDIFDNTESKEFKDYSCLNIVLFITDGTVKNGETNKIKIAKDVQNRNESHNAIFFTYSLGDPAEQDLLQHISCQNKGVWQLIQDGIDYSFLSNAMLQIYSQIFFALQQQKIYWSEVYTDFSTKLQLVTLSYPIIIDKGNYKQLLGVYGIDVLISEFQKYDNYQSKLNELWLQTRENCYDYSILSECHMEQFRQNMCYNEQCTIFEENVLKIEICDKNVDSTWKYTSGDEGGEYASICPETTKDDFSFCWTWWIILLVAISGVAFLGILIFIGFRLYNWSRKNKYLRFQESQKRNEQAELINLNTLEQPKDQDDNIIQTEGLKNIIQKKISKSIKQSIQTLKIK